MALSKKRWYDAIHFKPREFEAFWSKRLESTRDLLLILGLGWDPRMTTIAGVLRSFGGDGRRDLHLIRYSPSRVFKSPYQTFIEKNSEFLRSVVDGWASMKVIQIETRKEGNHYIGDERISDAYKELDLEGYTDVIVDVSSLPKSIYFSLLLTLVRKCIGCNENICVHVSACHDPEFDSRIIESADDTRFLKGFRGGLSMVSRQGIPRIWVPILARNSDVKIKKLFALEDLNPTDIYPILPFPSRNPRIDDDLLVECRRIFVSEWQLSPMNIIYAAEDDPLDVYRRLITLYNQQQEALEPLGGVRMVVSPLSSKLSSIGAFMAAFEEGMAVAHAIGRHTPPLSMKGDSWDASSADHFKANLHSIWLTGEPYVE
jgi:hypothetical protein